jgi:hypothetical protein
MATPRHGHFHLPHLPLPHRAPSLSLSCRCPRTTRTRRLSWRPACTPTCTSSTCRSPEPYLVPPISGPCLSLTSHISHLCPCHRVLVLVRSGCRQGRRRQRQVRALFVRMSVCVNGHLTTRRPPCHTGTNAAAALPPKQARQPAPLPLALRLPGQGQRRRGARRPVHCCGSSSPAPAAAARAPRTRARSSRRRR